MSDGRSREDDAPTEIGSLRVFPTVRKDDPEDVSWALSTAEAMWNRGDAAEAIKWIRRAAEAASECDRDDRALDLAKTAAELASLPEKELAHVVVAKPIHAPAAPAVTLPKPAPLAATPVMPPVAAKPPSVPPPAGARRPPTGLTPPVPVARPAAGAKPPASPATTTPTGPRPFSPLASPLPGPAVSPSATAATATPTNHTAATTTPSAAAAKPGAPRAPLVPKVTPVAVPKVVPPAVVQPAAVRPMLELVPQSRASLEPKLLEAGRDGDGAPEDRPTRVGDSLEASRPDVDRYDPETTSEVAVPFVPSKGARAAGMSRKVIAEDARPAGDLDAWPTQNMRGDDMDQLEGERTRLQVPVYVEGDSQATASRGRARPCQAVRVVLYRTADGILRIALHNAPISAVKVEAMLVALEPGADLLTWLGGD